MATHELGQHPDSKTPNIKCLICGMVSYHPKDIEHRYCGHCHRFHPILDSKRDKDRDAKLDLLRCLLP